MTQITKRPIHNNSNIPFSQSGIAPQSPQIKPALSISHADMKQAPNSDYILKVQTLQRVIRGHLARTAFLPKTQHRTIQEARKAVISRAREALGRHEWGDPLEIKPKNSKPVFLSTCQPGSKEFKIFNGKVFYPAQKKHFNLGDLSDLAYGHASSIVEKNPNTLVCPPENRGITAFNFYSNMAHAPRYAKAYYHELLAKEPRLSMNCVQFVLLTLYQEGIIPFKALQNNQYGVEIKANLSQPINKLQNGLEEGDIVFLINKDTGQPAHTCIFNGYDNDDEMTFIQLGFSKLTNQVNIEFNDFGSKYRLEGVKLENFFTPPQTLDAS